ncbi:hypothetical protein Slin15195_G127430 [Septoria linicola]|uniref:Uncharacterized protein n=1 Tax=Septoria linicola TaxID=215465 RepID=A0A9Q9B1U2_9PEZI|nr:hypothetical protein Slin14017_G083610 [Septoria linicola]USW59424.1 hypothetical protein Slin15195_G127430 [Septoria linicola]
MANNMNDPLDEVRDLLLDKQKTAVAGFLGQAWQENPQYEWFNITLLRSATPTSTTGSNSSLQPSSSSSSSNTGLPGLGRGMSSLAIVQAGVRNSTPSTSNTTPPPASTLPTKALPGWRARPAKAPAPEVTMATLLRDLLVMDPQSNEIVDAATLNINLRRKGVIYGTLTMYSRWCSEDEVSALRCGNSTFYADLFDYELHSYKQGRLAPDNSPGSEQAVAFAQACTNILARIANSEWPHIPQYVESGYVEEEEEDADGDQGNQVHDNDEGGVLVGEGGEVGDINNNVGANDTTVGRLLDNSDAIFLMSKSSILRCRNEVGTARLSETSWLRRPHDAET